MLFARIRDSYRRSYFGPASDYAGASLAGFLQRWQLGGDTLIPFELCFSMLTVAELFWASLACISSILKLAHFSAATRFSFFQTYPYTSFQSNEEAVQLQF